MTRQIATTSTTADRPRLGLVARLGMIAAVVVLALGVAAGSASAQSLGGLEPGLDDSNPRVDTGSPFQVGQGVHFIVPDVQPSDTGGSGGATGGTGGGDAGAGLAVTGTDVEPIVAISAGLLALGGSAVVASRRRISALS